MHGRRKHVGRIWKVLHFDEGFRWIWKVLRIDEGFQADRLFGRGSLVAPCFTPTREEKNSSGKDIDAIGWFLKATTCDQSGPTDEERPSE